MGNLKVIYTDVNGETRTFDDVEEGANLMETAKRFGVEVHKSSGSQRLDDAALAAVRRWRFVPARTGERTVAGIALVPIHFQLDG